MSEEETYEWREQRCGCRYRVELMRTGRFFDRRVLEVEYCDECHQRWTYIDWICANPRQRKRMETQMDEETLSYVRRRQGERERSDA